MPAGTIATGTFEPASASTQRWTMPSPPQTNTSSAPSFSALRACFGAFLLFGTSYQSNSSTPCSASSERSWSRPPPSDFFWWATTATVPTRFGGGVASGADGLGAVWCSVVVT